MLRDEIDRVFKCLSSGPWGLIGLRKINWHKFYDQMCALPEDDSIKAWLELSNLTIKYCVDIAEYRTLLKTALKVL